VASWREGSDRTKWADGFRQRLKAALISRFGTIAEAARELGVPYKTLDRWIRPGKELPRIDDVWAICRVGSISTDFLVWNEGDRLRAATPKPGGAPWLAASWSSETRHELAIMLREYLHAYALDYIGRAHTGDMEHLHALSSDPAHPRGPDDFDASREIVEDVVNLASDYLAKLQGRIREDVNHNIEKRLAQHMRYRRGADLAQEQRELRGAGAERTQPPARRATGKPKRKPNTPKRRK
jgi:hypothetical protein